jgi:hypothetical protein
MFLTPILDYIRRRFKRKPAVGMVAYKVAPRVYPILDFRVNRPAPEWGQGDEELHVWSLAAEDGRLRIYRDYSQRQRPVVEVHVNDFVVDLRDCYRQNNFYHPKWLQAHRAAASWLDRHRCDSLQNYQSGFWVLNWDVKKTKAP